MGFLGRVRWGGLGVVFSNLVLNAYLRWGGDIGELKSEVIFMSYEGVGFLFPSEMYVGFLAAESVGLMYLIDINSLLCLAI